MAARIRIYEVTAYSAAPPALPPRMRIYDVAAIATPATIRANAGPDQAAIEPWSICTLDGNGSSGPNLPLSYAWTQTAGTTADLSDPTAVSPTFDVPGSLAGETLKFQLTATDALGGTATDTVDITVLPVTDSIVYGGVEVPVHWMTVA